MHALFVLTNKTGWDVIVESSFLSTFFYKKKIFNILMTCWSRNINDNDDAYMAAQKTDMFIFMWRNIESD